MRIAQYGIAQNAWTRSSQTKKVSTKTTLDMNPSATFQETLASITAQESLTAKRAKMSLIDTLMAILSNQKPRYDTPIDFSEPSAFRPLLITTHTASLITDSEMHYDATGVVQTESGEEIDFTCEIHFSKTTMETMESWQTTGGKLIDPLVINLDNQGMMLSDRKVKMDLDLDGHLDTFNMLSKGSGFLVLDKNHNGKVDDGSELFGPTSNDGFAELRVFDEDGNLWLDENDEIFKDLKVWLIDADGNEKLLPLKNTNVGAIFLDAIGSFYDLKDTDTKGQITHTGLYLKNNGEAGVIHEVKV